MGLRAGASVYYTSRWARLRWSALRRDGFACVKCGARGKLEVDHVESIRTAPARAYDLSNLQCLCPSCHTAKTNIEMGRIPVPGRDAWRALVKDMTHATKGK